MSTKTALLLTPGGTITPVDLPGGDERNAIQLHLDTDLIGVQALAPGLDAWRDLRACLDRYEVNLAFAWIADKILALGDSLPRVYGAVVLTSDDGHYDQPTGLTDEALELLRAVFDKHAPDCSVYRLPTP